MENPNQKVIDLQNEKDFCDDETPTVLYCPECQSTNITFVRCTALCLDCNHNWSPS